MFLAAATALLQNEWMQYDTIMPVTKEISIIR
jgi:hypothetical protein